jgi:hypothetical protein
MHRHVYVPVCAGPAQTAVQRPGEPPMPFQAVVRQLDMDTVAHNAILGIPSGPGRFACGPFGPWAHVVVKAEVRLPTRTHA